MVRTTPDREGGDKPLPYTRGATLDRRGGVYPRPRSLGLALVATVLLCATTPGLAQELSAGARQALLEPRDELPPVVVAELTDAWEARLGPVLAQAWGGAYDLDQLGVKVEEVGGARRVVLRVATFRTREGAPGALDASALDVCLVVGVSELEPSDVFGATAEPGEPIRLGGITALQWKQKTKRTYRPPGGDERKPMWVSNHTLIWSEAGWCFRVQETRGIPGKFVQGDARPLSRGFMEAATEAGLLEFLGEIEQPAQLTLLEAAPALTGVPLEGLDEEALAGLDIVRQAVAADGVSKLVIRVGVPAAGSVTLDVPAGQVESLFEGRTFPVGGGQVAYALYTAPNGADYGQLLPLRVCFTPKAGGRPRFSEGRLRLEPPPVVLVHGLGEAPGELWAALVARLRDEAKLSVFLLDCSDVEGGLEAHQRSLWGGPGAGIKIALSAMRESGVAVARVDVVTHGAGALLARAWIGGRRYRRAANFDHGDVRRLITLAAPHRGCDLARAFEALRGVSLGERVFADEVAGVPYAGAWSGGLQAALAAELGPDSPALVGLGEATVATHAIAGVAREVDLLEDDAAVLRALLAVGRGLAADTARLRPLLDQVGQSARLDALAASLGAFDWTGDAWREGAAKSGAARSLAAELRAALFGGTQNDGVVRVESQWGGIEPPYVSTFPGVPHGRAPSQPAIVERIHALLTGDGSEFAASLPSPEAPVRNVAPR